MICYEYELIGGASYIIQRGTIEALDTMAAKAKLLENFPPDAGAEDYVWLKRTVRLGTPAFYRTLSKQTSGINWRRIDFRKST